MQSGSNTVCVQMGCSFRLTFAKVVEILHGWRCIRNILHNNWDHTGSSWYASKIILMSCVPNRVRLCILLARRCDMALPNDGCARMLVCKKLASRGSLSYGSMRLQSVLAAGGSAPKVSKSSASALPHRVWLPCECLAKVVLGAHQLAEDYPLADAANHLAAGL